MKNNENNNVVDLIQVVTTSNSAFPYVDFFATEADAKKFIRNSYDQAVSLLRANGTECGENGEEGKGYEVYTDHSISDDMTNARVEESIYAINGMDSELSDSNITEWFLVKTKILKELLGCKEEQ